MRFFNTGIYNKFDSINLCIEKLIGVQAQYNQFAMISIVNRTKECSRAMLDELGKKITL